jgi:hypothetical protein
VTALRFFLQDFASRLSDQFYCAYQGEEVEILRLEVDAPVRLDRANDLAVELQEGVGGCRVDHILGEDRAGPRGHRDGAAGVRVDARHVFSFLA